MSVKCIEGSVFLNNSAKYIKINKKQKKYHPEEYIQIND